MLRLPCAPSKALGPASSSASPSASFFRSLSLLGAAMARAARSGGMKLRPSYSIRVQADWRIRLARALNVWPLYPIAQLELHVAGGALWSVSINCCRCHVLPLDPALCNGLVVPDTPRHPCPQSCVHLPARPPAHPPTRGVAQHGIVHCGNEMFWAAWRRH